MPFDEDHSGADVMDRGLLLRATLPEIWLETGSSLVPDPTDDFWNTQNVYQCANSDGRYYRNLGDALELWYPTQTGAEWGQSLFVIHERQRNLWYSQWQAIGKRFKVIPLLVGFAAGGQHQLYHNPLDFTSDGQPSFFKQKGIDDVSGFVEDAVDEYAALLDGAGFSRREVVATLDDLEVFDQYKGHPTTMANNLADPRASTEPVNSAGLSMIDWLATRTTKLDGNPLPAWNASYNQFHPENWEAIRQGQELETCVVARAIDFAIAQHFRSAFGTIRHGSWRMYSSTRARPIPFRTDQETYLIDGDFALGLDVPANYRDIPANPWRTEASLGDADPRWESIERTSAALGISPANQDTAAAEINIDVCRQLHRIPGRELFPCLKVETMPGTLGDATYTAARDEMIRWMLDAGHNGARRFWVHTPDYDISATERARVQDLVQEFNRRWLAGE